MQNSLTKADFASVRALAAPLTPKQENSVLNHLPDAIAVLQWDEHKGALITFANPAFCTLFDSQHGLVHRQRLAALFPPSTYGTFHQMLDQAATLQTRQELNLTYRGRGPVQQLRISIVPSPKNAQADASSWEEEAETELVLCINDVTDLTNRAQFLEERAVKLIDHAQGLELSRASLETTVEELRNELSNLQRTMLFDSVSGLANRFHFIERGAAEFQRSQRYGHDLSVVVLSVQGYYPVKREYGSEIADMAIGSVSDMCSVAWRHGMDFGGRTMESEISIMLPETNLTGAMQFVERLQEYVSTTPVQLGRQSVRFSVLACVDCKQTDDTAFIEMLSRAKKAQSAIPPYRPGDEDG